MYDKIRQLSEILLHPCGYLLRLLNLIQESLIRCLMYCTVSLHLLTAPRLQNTANAVLNVVECHQVEGEIKMIGC